MQEVCGPWMSIYTAVSCVCVHGCVCEYAWARAEEEATEQTRVKARFSKKSGLYFMVSDTF